MWPPNGNILVRALPITPDRCRPLTEGAYPDARADLRWFSRKRRGALLLAALGYVLRKVLRRTTSSVTFDATSFHEALARVPEDSLLILAPSHRSYFDFLLTSLLFFEHPEFGVGRVHIAAADDFSRIPLISPILRCAGAFYVQRNVGRRSAALDEQIRRIVERRESMMFFIEGKRSRDRSVLPPKRGLLRALQATGRRFVLVPVAISYDRLAEEESLALELTQGRRARMSLSAIVRWLVRVCTARVQLGTIHLAAGRPLSLTPEVDVPTLALQIVDEQRGATVVSDFHLRCFLEDAGLGDVDLAWLREALHRRGMRVLPSELDVPTPLQRYLTHSLENQWRHCFIGDALELFPDNAQVREEASLLRGSSLAPGDRDDPRVRRVVESLFLRLHQRASSPSEGRTNSSWLRARAYP